MSNQEQLYQLEQIMDNKLNVMQGAKDVLNNNNGSYRLIKKYKNYLLAKKEFEIVRIEYERLKPPVGNIDL